MDEKSEKRIGKVKQKSLPRTKIGLLFMLNDKEMNAEFLYLALK